MTKEELTLRWAERYGEGCRPLAHLFRHSHPDRWVRIHSLPESKRYAEDDTEWATLLERQNAAITGLLGEGTPIVLISGAYFLHGTEVDDLWPEAPSLAEFTWTPWRQEDLHAIDADAYAPGWVYEARFCVSTWQAGAHDALLRDIADDRTRAMLLSIPENVLVAPYDGGIDFILQDRASRNAAKERFKAWLSPRPDGL